MLAGPAVRQPTRSRSAGQRSVRVCNTGSASSTGCPPHFIPSR